MALRAEWRYSPDIRQWVVGTWQGDDVPEDVFGTVAPATLTSAGPGARKAMAEALYRAYGVRPPARVFDGPPGEQSSMTCPVCWRVSFAAKDVRERYCGHCHAWPESAQAAAGDPPASVQSGQSA
jgi:hypothetical protein